MTLTKDDLQAISDIVEERLGGLKSDVSDLKSRMSKVETDMNEVKSQIVDLQNDVTDIKVNKQNNGAIRILNDLHSCYVDTYERYKNYI